MKKIANWYFLVLALFPFALSVCYARAGSSFNIIQNDIFSAFRFPPFARLLISVTSLLTQDWTFSSVAANACSWVLMVFFVWLCYQFIVFVPSVCINAFQKGGDKT